ncbi:MAG: hypothetical protein H6696_15110 [Deferribacteres bacterium]|nr:hypothetical protein [candidate division KSB1 bacterium]MCB9503258.1 hypothetical protein [Deferribacteres bacterium]
MLNDFDKNSLLDEILKSEDFQRSQKYSELLSYLFEAYLEGKQLKEMIIAIECFGKDAQFNPSDDPIVRVYIGNLRKKLEHYYLTEGKSSPYKLDIPRGHYDIQITKQEPAALNPKNIHPIYLSIIFLLFTIIIFLWFGGRNTSQVVNGVTLSNPVWEEFLQNSKPTLVVLGDHFFMYKYRDDKKNSKAYIRYADINSPQAYHDFVHKHPDLQSELQLLDFTYMRPSIAWSLSEILPIIKTSDNEITLKLASELLWSDMENHNVIFIGQFKTLYILEELLKSFQVEFEAIPPALSILNENMEKKQSFIPELPDQGKYHQDYGVLIKAKGTGNNSILFILGFDEVGVIGATKKVAAGDFVETINSDSLIVTPESPFYFRSVFKIQGFRRTDIESELLYFEPIQN